MTPYYRIAEDSWNVLDPPWRGAVGIEYVDTERSVPALVAWFTRGGNQLELAEKIVELLNQDLHPRTDWGHDK